MMFRPTASTFALAVSASAAVASKGCLNSAIINAKLPVTPIVGGASSLRNAVVPLAEADGAFKSSASSTVLPVLQRLRGGSGESGGGVAPLDFSRESMLIQGLGTYGTITALILNAALRMWTSTKFPKDQSKFVSDVFYVSTTLCVMSGAFTAILFQLLIVYSKTALGNGNDEGYLFFKSATAACRRLGFRCFLTEVITFVGSFLMSLYNTLWMDAEKRGGAKKGLTGTGIWIYTGSVLLMLLG